MAPVRPVPRWGWGVFGEAGKEVSGTDALFVVVWSIFVITVFSAARNVPKSVRTNPQVVK